MDHLRVSLCIYSWTSYLSLNTFLSLCWVVFYCILVIANHILHTGPIHKLKALKMVNTCSAIPSSKCQLSSNRCLILVALQCLQIIIFYILFRVYTCYLYEGWSDKSNSVIPELNFLNLGLNFYYMVWCIDHSFVFPPILMSFCSSTIFWKDFSFSHGITLAPFVKNNSPYMCVPVSGLCSVLLVYHLSVLTSAPYCLKYCSFIISLNII